MIFIVWLAGLSNKATKCFDIYFSQGVGGLNKGSSVNFQGVPVGQIEKISLLPDRPEFVWVRVVVDAETPVLQGTTAQIKGVGFTGVSEIALEGAVKGAGADPGRAAGLPGHSGQLRRPRRTAQQRGTDRPHPAADRAADRAAERPNQNSISDILENVDKTTAVLAKRRPTWPTRSPMRGSPRAMPDRRAARRRAGRQHHQLVNEQGKPAAEDLRKAIAAVQRSAENLDAMVADARPACRISARTRCLK